MSSSGNTKIKIKVSDSDPAVDPILVSFPGGVPSTNEAKFVWRKVARTKGVREIVGNDGVCQYHGRNDAAGGRTKIYVGLYHKPTKTLRLQPTANNSSVYSLQQSVINYTPSIEESQSTARETRQALFGDFGSAKRQKVMRSQAANVVNVDSVIGAGSAMKKAFLQNQTSESNRQALEQARSGEIQTDALETAHAEALRNHLPAFDADAKEPHLVYSARDIAGDDAWGQVSRVTDACLHGSEENWVTALTSRGGPWFPSVKALLESLDAESPSKYQIKCAILLNNMISFQRRQSEKKFLRGNLSEVAQYLKLPMEIASRFLELFTTAMPDDRGNEGFACSKNNKERCLIHILLLYLMAHGRSMKVSNIKPIADDVRMEVSRAAAMLRTAGCTVKSISKGAGMSAALTVPLEFPQRSRRRGRG